MKNLTPEAFLAEVRVLPLKLEANIYRAKIDIGIMVINLFEQSWRDHVLPGGNNVWRPRANPKIQRPLLVDTGRLKESFSFEINDYSVRVYNDCHYAKYHNDPDGSWGNNIQRQFLGTSDYIERQIHNRILLAIRFASET